MFFRFRNSHPHSPALYSHDFASWRLGVKFGPSSARLLCASVPLWYTLFCHAVLCVLRASAFFASSSVGSGDEALVHSGLNVWDGWGDAERRRNVAADGFSGLNPG